MKEVKNCGGGSRKESVVSVAGTGQLHFGQAWLAEPEKGFRPGCVHLGRNEDDLQVDAVLEDECVWSASTANHQRMHQLGDVFEIFLQGPGRTDYHEFHISANGHIWQLHFPEVGYLKKHPEVELEDLVVVQPLFTHRIGLVAGGWRIWAVISLGELWGRDFREKGKDARVSFGRYDYGSTGGAPVISSTSPHSIPYFHRVEEWKTIRIESGI